jgi:formyl-CoA transferase
MEKLEKADIAFARVNDCGLLATHPHLRRIEIGTPSGLATMPAPAPLFDEARRYGAVPALGEHTEKVRREFLGS